MCAVEAAVSLLEGKWKCIILFHLLHGKARFSQLRRRMPNVAQRSLTNQLRELEAYGLIERKIYAEVPTKVEYGLTPFGQTFEPVLLAMKRWGEHLLEADTLIGEPLSTPPTKLLN